MDQRVPIFSGCHSGGAPASTLAPVPPPRPSPTFPSSGHGLPSTWQNLNAQNPVQSVVRFHHMYISPPSDQQQEPSLKRRRLMSQAELADLAMVDPEQAKRIIEDRQANAKAEQMRMRILLQNEQERRELQAQHQLDQQRIQSLSALNEKLQRDMVQLQLRLHVESNERRREVRQHQLEQRILAERLQQRETLNLQQHYILERFEEQLQQFAAAAAAPPPAMASPTETNITDMDDSSSSSSN